MWNGLKIYIMLSLLYYYTYIYIYSILHQWNLICLYVYYSKDETENEDEGMPI